MSNQIRDLFHTVKTTDLTGLQIANGFGEIYLSKDTIENQLVSQEIVAQVQSTKAPFYGSPIPGSFEIVSTTGEPGRFLITNAQTNKTYQVLAVSVDNIGLGSLDVTLWYSDGSNFVKLSEQTAIAANESKRFVLENGYFIDSNVQLYAEVTTGTEVDALLNVVEAQVIQ